MTGTPQLEIYNTQSRKKEVFQPINPDLVRMYVCGPTVYDFAHIGNARPVVVFDVVFRVLQYLYGREHVRYVRNITDVDDKIIEAAKKSGEAIADLTRRTAAAFHEDMAKLMALTPDLEPRATDHIAQMIAMIKTLIDKGHAYEAGGHVLFSVPSMPEYGKLSRCNRDEMVSGARVEVAAYKNDPADFILWKPSTSDQPGWESPWGRGRPGWHIECSAMSEVHLGEFFDIHGGGLDLIFPHHENEIAQSVCAHDHRAFVKYWMHNGFVQINGEKMSKSLGNFFTVHELLKEGFAGEAIRFALLSAQYRQPLDISRDRVREAKARLDHFYTLLQQVQDTEGNDETGAMASHRLDLAQSPVLKALLNDFNTPEALTQLGQSIDAMAQMTDKKEQAERKKYVMHEAWLLGLLQQAPTKWFQAGVSEQDKEKIKARIAERAKARKDKDFARADAIRDSLLDEGIILEDTSQGTIWRRI